VKSLIKRPVLFNDFFSKPYLVEQLGNLLYQIFMNRPEKLMQKSMNLIVKMDTGKEQMALTTH
jgi:hypothetical protein